MKTNLENYYIEKKRLVEEIRTNKLNCLEAQIRCKDLWKLIPSDTYINPFTVNNLMEEKYSNSPDWNYSKKFK